MRIPISGTQHAIGGSGYEAVIAGVGASLRSLSRDGRDLVVPYRAEELRPSHRGATIAPWPNRLVDGRYRFDGVDYRLPLTEPARGHAIHGLVSWLEFVAIDEGPSHVTLAARIEPQPGYPWRIRVLVTYAIGSEGITQSVTATNESDDAAPFGCAAHPYLLPGDGVVNDALLTVPADLVKAVAGDRMLPLPVRPVDADDPARFDWRTPRRIGAAKLDHAFTGLVHDPAGIARVTVTDAEGLGAEMVLDGSCPWVQIFTADTPDPTDPRNRIGVAVEPMTCGPDAFNDPFAGLHVLEPEGRTLAQWRIAAIG